MTVLWITPETRDRIRAILAFANAPENWYRPGPGAPIPGNDHRYCVGVSDSYKVVYSIVVVSAACDTPPEPFRYLTLSAPSHAPFRQRLPGPAVFRELIKEFGFTDAAAIDLAEDPSPGPRTMICIAQEPFTVTEPLTATEVPTVTTTTPPTIDRSAWPPGPWDGEPDRCEWRDPDTGLPCLAVRSDTTGAWCGYVAVPPGHPLHGHTCEHADASDLSAHGGLTYAGECSGHICHVPAPGEPDDVWWFGFDCAHARDISPILHYVHCSPELRAALMRYATYRDLAYVREEVTQLAAQLRSAIP